jgi:hypothetical protein
MFEWLTVCPTCAPFPVNSQRRDMVENLAFPSLAPARQTDETSGIDWTADV